MKKKPLKVTEVSIGGETVDCYTITELAKRVDRRPGTIRKMHQEGLLPEANFRIGDTLKGDGRRIYTVELVDELVPLFAKIQKGVPISSEVKQGLKRVFSDEREKYLS